MGNLIKAFFNAIYKLAVDTVNILFYPITAFVNTLFPDLSTYINSITTFINTNVTPLIAYFGNMLPPITKTIVLLWLGFLVIYYTAVWTYTLSVKIFNVIRKIKFW